MGTLRVTLLALCAASAVMVGCKSEISGGAVDGGDQADSDVPPPPIDAAPQPDAPLPCVEGDVQGTDPASGNCYWVTYTTVLTWVDARQACIDAGGHLATMTTQAESEYVNGLAISAYQASLAGTPVVDYFMGATDREPNTEGVFVWDNGENFGFDNWRDGEPNDGGLNGEDCGIIEADVGGTWDDRPCATPQYGYVCERE